MRVDALCALFPIEDIGNITVEITVVEAISDDEDIFDFKTAIIWLDVHLSSRRLVQKGAGFYACGSLGLDIANDEFHGDSGIDDIVNDENIITSEVIWDLINHFTGTL